MERETANLESDQNGVGQIGTRLTGMASARDMKRDILWDDHVSYRSYIPPNHWTKKRWEKKKTNESIDEQDQERNEDELYVNQKQIISVDPTIRK